MVIQISKGMVNVSEQEIYKHINKTNAAINADIVLNNFSKFTQIPALSKRDSYIISSHKISEVNLPVNRDNFRLEEWTCINMVINNPNLKGADFGTLIGYQIPLKTPKLVNPNINRGLGKIDILSQKNDTAFILELKVEKSTEHPLRAFLEAYTYWKLLGGNSAADFLIKSDAYTATRLEKAVVIYKDSPIHKELKKVIANNGKIIQLIRKLGVRCFLIENDVSDKNGVSFTYAEEQVI